MVEGKGKCDLYYMVISNQAVWVAREGLLMAMEPKQCRKSPTKTVTEKRESHTRPACTATAFSVHSDVFEVSAMAHCVLLPLPRLFLLKSTT
jgi:hypothetical protein